MIPRSCFTALWLLASLGTLAAETHSGTLVMEFDLSTHEAGQEARLWIPYPVSDKDQQVGRVKVSGDFAEAAVYTDSAWQAPILFARWDKDAKSRKLTYAFAVERREVRRRDLPAREAAWDPADYAAFLAPTRLGPTDGKVRELANEITKGKTTVLEKARAIYDWICENMRRDPKIRGCGTGDVRALLETPAGKCADIHSMFVALARAAGVPSRDVFGLRQGKQATEDVTTGQSCWAEFFLPGCGWVPVDPAAVLKAQLTRNLKPSDPEAAAIRASCFGALDPLRVKFNCGRDLTLNPRQEGEPLNFLMYPCAQVGGKTLDPLDAGAFRYTITYRADAGGGQ
jgi:transglutaminase-like putative cysteine protease